MSVESRSKYRSDPGHLGQAGVKISIGSPGQPHPAWCKKTSPHHNNNELNISLEVSKI